MALHRAQYSTAMGPPKGHAYRAPVPLPFELSNHVRVLFEEKLYTPALTLLFTTLSSGTYASKQAFLPTSQCIALASTLLVHPSTTTHAKTPQDKEAAVVALKLLRLLTTIIRPQDAGLTDTFSFTRAQKSRTGRRQQIDNNAFDLKDGSFLEALKIELCTTHSLWNRAQDFWHAVGWAFNCSANHPKRWEQWHIWLQYMCDVLEDDWIERKKIFEEERGSSQSVEAELRTAKNNGGDQEDFAILRESLLYQYMTSGPSSGHTRRMIRAIFADGSTSSVNEFGKIFANELKPVNTEEKTESAKKRGRDVNIDQEEYGDYLVQDDTDGEDADAPIPFAGSAAPANNNGRRSKRTRRGTRSAPDPAGEQAVERATDGTNDPSGIGALSLGGTQAIALRKRLFQSLIMVSSDLEDDLVSPVELFDLYVEYVRPLPLPAFQAIVSPFVTPDLSDESHTSMCEFLISRLLESAAPPADESLLTQTKLENHYLRYAAASSSATDNVKISILLEALLVLLADSRMLVVTPAFKNALEAGIQRRLERSNEGHRRTKKKNDHTELDWLTESGERLSYLLELLPHETGTCAGI